MGGAAQKKRQGGGVYPLKLHFKDESAVGWDAAGDSLGPVGEGGWDDEESLTGFLHSQHSFLPALLPKADGRRKLSGAEDRHR